VRSDVCVCGRCIGNRLITRARVWLSCSFHKCAYPCVGVLTYGDWVHGAGDGAPVGTRRAGVPAVMVDKGDGKGSRDTTEPRTPRQPVDVTTGDGHSRPRG
jgi:hypothetical protein